jgi:outer membrane lipoprotein-sorting protein
VAKGGEQSATVKWKKPSKLSGGNPTSYLVTASPDGSTCSSVKPLCVFNGLSDGSSLTFTVVGVDVLGAGAASAPSNAVVIGTVPGAPTDVQGVSANGAVDVSWAPPPVISGLPIVNYTVTAKPGGATCSAETTECTVSGLTNGKGYKFYVSATDAVGTGPLSASSPKVVPIALPPNAPTGVTAVSGATSATVSFQVPYDNGNPILHFDVTAVDATNANRGGQKASGTGSPIVVAGLADGDRYNFLVTATSAAGTSAPGTSFSWGFPTEVTGSGANSRLTGVSCVGTDCTGAGEDGSGQPYVVAESNGVWGAPEELTATAVGGTLTGISCTSAVDCTAVGMDDDLQPVVVVESGGAWGPVTELPADGGAGTLAAVACSAPGTCVAVGSDGNDLPITVEIDGGVAQPPVEETGEASGSFNGVNCWGVGSCIAVGSDGNGQPMVAAESGGSWLAPSEYGAPGGGGELTSGSCDAAGNCVVVGTDVNNVPLVGYSGPWGTQWQELAAPGGGVLTGLSCGAGACIGVGVDGDGQPIEVPLDQNSQPIDLPTLGGSGTLDGASCSSATFCTVVGVDGDQRAFALTEGTVPASVASAPSGVSAVAEDAQANVSWTAPLADGGSTIESYTASDGVGDSCTTPDGSTTGCTITGLTNGSTYSFTVFATNAIGAGPVSGASAALTLPTVPGAPLHVVAASVSNASAVTITWTDPASDGGSPITSFVASSADGVTCSAPPTATSCTAYAFASNPAEVFGVRAVNALGTGPTALAPAIPITLTGTTVPAPVSGIVMNPPSSPGLDPYAGDRSLTVSWTGTADPTETYRAVASPGGNSCTGALVPPNGSNAPNTFACSITGLIFGTSYLVTITPSNAAGAGPASSIVGTVTLANIRSASHVGTVDPAFNGPDAMAFDGRHVWVANRTGNTVTELDASTGATIAVLSGSQYGFSAPAGIAFDNQLDRIWVTDSGSHSVTVFSAATGQNIQVLSTDNQPQNIVYSGGRILESNYAGGSDGKGSVTEWATNGTSSTTWNNSNCTACLLSGPTGLVFLNSSILVANRNNSTISALYDAAGQCGGKGSGAHYAPQTSQGNSTLATPTAITTDGVNVYVTNAVSGTNSVWPAAEYSWTNCAMTLMQQFENGAQTMRGIMFDGSRVWMASASTNAIYALNSTGLDTVAYYDNDVCACGFSGPSTIISDGSHLWVSNPNQNSVSEIDGAVVPSALATPSNVTASRASSTSATVTYHNATPSSECYIQAVDLSTGPVPVAIVPRQCGGTGYRGGATIGSLTTGHTYVFTVCEVAPTNDLFGTATSSEVTISPDGPPPTGGGLLLRGGNYGFNFNSGVPGENTGIAFDGTHLWITNAFGNSVTEVNASDGSWVRTLSGGSYGFSAPMGIAFDGTNLWVANQGGVNSNNGSVTEFSAATGAFIRNVAPPLAAITMIVAVGGNLWATSGSQLLELRKSDGAVLQTLNDDSCSAGPIGPLTPTGMATDGTNIWLTGGSIAYLQAWVVNPSNNSCVGTVPLASDSSSAEGITFDGTHMWLSDYGSSADTGSVTEVTASNLTVVRQIAASGDQFNEPMSGGFDGTHVWFPNYKNSTVTELNVSDGSLVAAQSMGTLGISGVSGAGDAVTAAGGVWFPISAGTTSSIGELPDPGTQSVGSPTSIVAAVVGTTATVSFVAPSHGLSPGVTYSVTGTDLTNPIGNRPNVTGPASPIAVTGLQAGDSYSFAVVAVSAVGTSAPSTSTTPQTIPGPATLSGSNYGFSKPTASVSDGSNVWVANATGNSVTELGPNGSFLALINTTSCPACGFASPDGLVFDGTHLWVSNAKGGSDGKGSLTELDPASGGLVGTVTDTTCATCAFGNIDGLAFDGANLWVQSDASLTELSAGSGAFVSAYSGTSYGFNHPSAPVFDGNELWVANFGDASNPGSLTEVKVATPGSPLVVTDATCTGCGFSEPSGLAWDGAHVWVTNKTGGSTHLGSVTEVSAASGWVQTLSSSALGLNGPVGIAYDGTSLWVTNSSANTVSRFSTGGTSISTAVLPAGSSPTAAMFDGAAVWIMNSGGNTVSRIAAP